MNLFKKIFFLFFIALLVPFSGLAQRDLFNWQVSPYAGLLTVNKDISLPDNSNFFTYGLRLDRRVGDAFTVGVNFSYINTGIEDRSAIAGGFINLAYHWDNGYLLSQRSCISLFHRIEAGYTDKTKRLENLDGTGGEITFGFENGLKFRLGDRISADLALEILGSKKSITEGDIAENLRYNIWKVGVNYHFGNRKSKFVAPVFVPSPHIQPATDMTKIDSKEDSLWIVADEKLFPEAGLLPDSLSPDTTRWSASKSKISRADSLAIFMHFDSLYRRITPVDTAGIMQDTTLMKMEEVQADTLNTEIDSTRSGKLQYRATPDTLSQKADTVYIQKVDTVYIQKADTSGQLKRQAPGRVDTIYMKQSSEPAEENPEYDSSDRDRDRSDTDNSGNRNNTSQSNGSADDQSDRIDQNQRDIERLERNSNNNSTDKNDKNGKLGTALAAGAAGVAVGALAKGKKSRTDTIYYVDKTAQAKIDSLQREIEALKQSQGISDPNINANSTYVSNPPIGQYYTADSASVDSLAADSMQADTAMVDSLSLTVDSTRIDTLPLPSYSLTDSTMTTDTPEVSPEVVDSILYQSADPDSTAWGKPKLEGTSAESGQSADSSATKSDYNTGKLAAEYPVSCTFELNSTEILSTDTAKLNRVVSDLNNDASRNLLLTGRTDKSGNADYNLKLSGERAQEVKKYFTSKGIDPDRISIERKGATGASQDYNQTARRVDIRLVD